MLEILLRYLAKQWQRRCDHPSESVCFDILEGGGGQHVSQCNLCGATKIGFKGRWRRSDALYHPHLDTSDLIMRHIMPSAFLPIREREE